MSIFLLKILLGVLSLSTLIIAVKLFLVPIFKKKNLWYKMHAENILLNNSAHLSNENPYSVNHTKGLSFFRKIKNSLVFDLQIQSRPHDKGWEHI